MHTATELHSFLQPFIDFNINNKSQMYIMFTKTKKLILFINTKKKVNTKDAHYIYVICWSFWPSE